MKYLSVDDVVVIHDRYVEEFGGSLGTRDENLLDSAVFRCQSSFGGKDLYSGIFEKAAALFHSLLLNHPFVDGNKRAAMFCTIRFLFINGFNLSATNDEVEKFPLFVESERPEIEEIAAWFKAHTKKH